MQGTLILSPRTYASAGEWARDVVGLAQRIGILAAVYRYGRLDATLRELVMVAVSRVNACGGCTFVHQRWALRAGVTSEELEAIGLRDLEALDEQSRAAVVYASAHAETRFRRSIAPDVTAGALEHLSVDDMKAIEAVARLMSFANLSVSTAEAFAARVRRRTSLLRRSAGMQRVSRRSGTSPDRLDLLDPPGRREVAQSRHS